MTLVLPKLTRNLLPPPWVGLFLFSFFFSYTQFIQSNLFLLVVFNQSFTKGGIVRIIHTVAYTIRILFNITVTLS